MKKFFVFILLSVTALPLFAGSAIRGKIMDTDTHSPLQYVDVALFKIGSKSLTSGVTTDSLGAFVFPSIDDGKYIMRITFIEYTTVTKTVEIAGKPVDLGIINLKGNTKNLGEVEVVGQAPQMRFDIDKKVFSVDQNISAAGGSASDILKNIPSVNVDTQGNISLRNNANVEVWIDGKASGLTADNRAQVLEQMPAESIESVEIMTNPSAKYNPEGSAGIINLVMKKNHKAGYYGSVSAGLIYPFGGKLGSSLGASINYTSTKVDAYINLGYRDMNFQGGGYTNRTTYNGNNTLLLNQNSTMTNSFSGLFTRAGINYHLDIKNTIGLNGFGLAGSGNTTNDIHYLLTNPVLMNALPLRNYSQNNTGTSTRPSLNVNLDYEHDFNNKGSNLLANLSYSSHNRESDNSYVQSNAGSAPQSEIAQNSTNNSKTGEFKLDYTGKINENSKLEAGWQSDVTNMTTSASGYDKLHLMGIPSYYNNFNYDEQIHAAYVTYGTKFDQLSVQGGLRGEYFRKKSTNTTSNAVQPIAPKSYTELYPSLYLTYALPNDNELQLNYSRRVNRPRGQQINPFHNYSDSTRITYGNPNLDPEFTSSVELNYLKSWGEQTISASVYYHYTDNVIQNVQFLHSGVMESSFLNVTKSQNTGLELIAKNRLLSMLNLTTSLNLYYSKLDNAVYVNPYDSTITTRIPGQDNFSWTANILANITMSKTFSGQVTARYNSPQIIAQGLKQDKYSIDLGVRKTFLDRKLSVNLNVRDLLNSNKDRSTTSGTGFSQRSESYFHTRMVNLSISYNFGNSKPRKEDIKKKQEPQEPDMEDVEQ
ncbi:MAG: outer membrane beta-barrel family protein [Bacteroidota bacterium]|nr:outer membrane beta-barrel family protein [Bacteroidota bacterium]